MKKLLSVLLIAATVLTSFAATAQSTYTLRPQNAGLVFVAADTTHNADTSYLFTQLTPGYTTALQWTNTKVSGTVAGSVTVQGSYDDVAWYTLTTDKSQAPYLTDTVSATNGNTTGLFVLQHCHFGYLRVRIITTGTQQSTLSGTAYYFTQPAKMR